MPTTILLILTGLFVLNRWVQYRKDKRDELPLERIDTEFKDELNAGERHAE